jgi:hypothetical protein
MLLLLYFTYAINSHDSCGDMLLVNYTVEQRVYMNVTYVKVAMQVKQGEVSGISYGMLHSLRKSLRQAPCTGNNGLKFKVLGLLCFRKGTSGRENLGRRKDVYIVFVLSCV